MHMMRLIQTILIALLVAGLAASGTTTAHERANAKAAERIGGEAMMQAHAAHSGMKSHHNDVANADDEHCPHATASKDGDGDQAGVDGCRTCCVVCIIHAVIPEPLVALPGKTHRSAIYQRCKTLTGVLASADPGIPKR